MPVAKEEPYEGHFHAHIVDQQHLTHKNLVCSLLFITFSEIYKNRAVLTRLDFFHLRFRHALDSMCEQTYARGKHM